MKSIQPKKAVRAVSVFMMMVFLIPAFASATMFDDHQGCKGPGHHGQHMGLTRLWENPQMVKELELSDDQVKSLKEADFAFREKKLALQADADRLRLKMQKAFSGDSINADTIRSIAKEMSKVKSEMYLQKIEQRLVLNKTLNKGQIEKLKSFKAHHFSERGCKHRHTMADKGKGFERHGR